MAFWIKAPKYVLGDVYMFQLVKSSLELIDIEEEIINSVPSFNLLSKGKEIITKKEIEDEIKEAIRIGAERFILQENHKNIGIIEYLLHNPGDQSTWLGLLLIKGELQSQGYGKKAVKQYEALMNSKGIKKYRIGVIHNNEPAHQFWKKHGFYFIKNVINSDNQEIVIYEKTL